MPLERISRPQMFFINPFLFKSIFIIFKKNSFSQLSLNKFDLNLATHTTLGTLFWYQNEAKTVYNQIKPGNQIEPENQIEPGNHIK